METTKNTRIDHKDAIMKNADWLRRYTKLPQLIHVLRTRSLTLLDPKHWDDKNDGALIAKYREKYRFKRVLALCFTKASETYHHWRIYADGVAGICIEFDKIKLLESLTKKKGLRWGSVSYVRIDRLADYQKRCLRWPFIKRYPYAGEEEFRLIYEDRRENGEDAFQVSFDLKAINRIYLSPWIERDEADSVAMMIRYLPNCSAINVLKTTLVNNRKWQRTLVA